MARRTLGRAMAWTVTALLAVSVSPARAEIIDGLSNKFEDFRRAYDEKGMAVEAFDTFGPNVRTLRQFIEGYQSLVSTIRDFMLPNPDIKQ